MKYGDRIRQRLDELSRERGEDINVPWLARRTGIPQSTLYDHISRGDGSTRTATIARQLGLNPLWLESERGPRLADEPSAVERLVDKIGDSEQVHDLLLAFALLTKSQRTHYLHRIQEVADANDEIRRDLLDRNAEID